jgi:hypothetical protein
VEVHSNIISSITNGGSDVLLEVVDEVEVELELELHSRIMSSITNGGSDVDDELVELDDIDTE